MPKRASAIPEFDTMPPVVSSSGSLSISRPAPIGCERGTGRASTSRTQDPTTTQSNRFSMGKSPAVAELQKQFYFFFASSFSIAATTSGVSGDVRWLKRATTCPSRLNRNFSKFQGILPANFGSDSFDVSVLYNGTAFSPLTSTLDIRSNLTP